MCPFCRSRGRSPARKKSPARTASTSAAAKPKSPASTSRVSRRSTVTAPKPDPTPTRASARIAAKVELSSDEDDAAARRKSYLAPVSSGKKGIIGKLGKSAGRFSDREKIWLIVHSVVKVL